MPCFPTIFRHVGPIPVAAMLLCAAACIGEEPSAELFVPLADVRRAAVAEIRCDAVVEGPAITLRQVARWAEEDATAFSAVADLAVARFYEDKPTRTVQLADIRLTLEDAGVDLGAINFSGAVECKVIRSGPAVAPVPAECLHGSRQPSRWRTSARLRSMTRRRWPRRFEAFARFSWRTSSTALLCRPNRCR